MGFVLLGRKTCPAQLSYYLDVGVVAFKIVFVCSVLLYKIVYVLPAKTTVSIFGKFIRHFNIQGQRLGSC